MALIERSGSWGSVPVKVRTHGFCTGRKLERPRVTVLLRSVRESETDPGFVDQVLFDLDLAAVQQLRLILQDAERQLLAETITPERIAEVERQVELAPAMLFGCEVPPR